MPSKAKVKVTKVRTTKTAKIGKYRNRAGFSCPYFFLKFLQKRIDEHRKVCYYIIKLREASFPR